MAATEFVDGAFVRLMLASLVGKLRDPSLRADQYDATLDVIRRERDDLVDCVRLIVSRLKEETRATLFECGTRDFESGWNVLRGPCEESSCSSSTAVLSLKSSIVVRMSACETSKRRFGE